jgi:hypothetical protein
LAAWEFTHRLHQHRSDRAPNGAKGYCAVVALGGEKGLGAKVGEMVKMVAETVEAHTLNDCGHFIPEEAPADVVKHILGMTVRTMRGNKK